MAEPPLDDGAVQVIVTLGAAAEVFGVADLRVGAPGAVFVFELVALMLVLAVALPPGL